MSNGAVLPSAKCICGDDKRHADLYIFHLRNYSCRSNAYFNLSFCIQPLDDWLCALPSLLPPMIPSPSRGSLLSSSNGNVKYNMHKPGSNALDDFYVLQVNLYYLILIQ